MGKRVQFEQALFLKALALDCDVSVKISIQDTSKSKIMDVGTQILFGIEVILSFYLSDI